jgi:hypothetical protein
VTRFINTHRDRFGVESICHTLQCHLAACPRTPHRIQPDQCLQLTLHASSNAPRLSTHWTMELSVRHAMVRDLCQGGQGVAVLVAQARVRFQAAA